MFIDFLCSSLFDTTIGFAWRAIALVARIPIRFIASVILGTSIVCVLGGGTLWLFLWTLIEVVTPLAIQ